MKRIHGVVLIAISLLVLLLTAGTPSSPALPQTDNPNPPDRVVKLIFIHHSSGENWLADENGGLGIALEENNYFVSDTNYGWGPDAIGDTTDIPDWLKWFRSEDTERIMQAVYDESGQNSGYTRSLPDPGGENEIIMFKSCFPNSNLEGAPDDPPVPGEGLTVSNAKFVYNEILKYFVSRPDKLFIVITAPPLRKADTSAEAAANARAFNNWLVEDWLKEYSYSSANVAVFDFHNVLTGPDSHHRFMDDAIEHVFEPGKNYAHYPTEDSHPSVKGNRKATEEFVPLLNVYYHRWSENLTDQSPAATLPPSIASKEPVEETSPEEGSGFKLPCLGSFLLPLAVAGLMQMARRR